LRKYRVNIKPTAEEDLARRFVQIEAESLQDAVAWYLGIIEVIEKLDELAERCPIAPEDAEIQKSIRHLMVGRYRVLYLINNGCVDVLHVRHSRHDRRF